MGRVVLIRKPAVSLKQGKIGPRLLLMTNRKLHTHFRLVPKSATLDDLEGPLRTLKGRFGALDWDLNPLPTVISCIANCSQTVTDSGIVTIDSL